MLSVRIGAQTYKITNETLDSVLGHGWRNSDQGLLRKRIQDRLKAGGLVIRGQRLHPATSLEHSEQQLRAAESQEEILRWGLLYVGLQIAEAATGLWALGEASFDQSAATAKLSRDPAPENEQERPQGQ
jgi:hypothetical protein